MKLTRVERHIIVKSNINWKAIDELCFKAKNLYNKANYIVRQTFIQTYKEVKEGKRKHTIYLNYYDVCKEAKNWEEYKNLPAQSSQQILKLLDQNWRIFFKSMKEWKKNPSKFKGKPKLPKYKKHDRRFPVIFTNQQIRLKGNYICFPKKSKVRPN